VVLYSVFSCRQFTAEQGGNLLSGFVFLLRKISHSLSMTSHAIPFLTVTPMMDSSDAKAEEGRR